MKKEQLSYVCDLDINNIDYRKSDMVITCKLCKKSYKVPKELWPDSNTTLQLGFPCIVKLNRTPGLHEKIYNFIKALIRHLLDGFRKTSKKEKNRRLSICKVCEFYNGTACTKCGCPITMKDNFANKVNWKSEKCPENKW